MMLETPWLKGLDCHPLHGLASPLFKNKYNHHSFIIKYSDDTISIVALFGLIWRTFIDGLYFAQWSRWWGILGQIVALLSSLSTKWNQLPDENKNNQTSFIGHESLPCQACWDRWRSFWHPSDHPVGFVQHEAFTGWNPIFFCWRVTFVSPLSNAKHCLPPPIPLPQKTLPLSHL